VATYSGFTESSPFTHQSRSHPLRTLDDMDESPNDPTTSGRPHPTRAGDGKRRRAGVAALAITVTLVAATAAVAVNMSATSPPPATNVGRLTAVDDLLPATDGVTYVDQSGSVVPSPDTAPYQASRSHDDDDPHDDDRSHDSSKDGKSHDDDQHEGRDDDD